MRLLTLLGTLTLLLVAPAAEGVPKRAMERPQEMEQNDGSRGAELARSSAGIDLFGAETRTRDASSRGFGGKAPTARSLAADVSSSSATGIRPAIVHPAPAHAERLPYYATAPPSLS